MRTASNEKDRLPTKRSFFTQTCRVNFFVALAQKAANAGAHLKIYSVALEASAETEVGSTLMAAAAALLLATRHLGHHLHHHLHPAHHLSARSAGASSVSWSLAATGGDALVAKIDVYSALMHK